jgi:hypothetical protein
VEDRGVRVRVRGASGVMIIYIRLLSCLLYHAYHTCWLLGSLFTMDPIPTPRAPAARARGAVTSFNPEAQMTGMVTALIRLIVIISCNAMCMYVCNPYKKYFNPNPNREIAKAEARVGAAISIIS